MHSSRTGFVCNQLPSLCAALPDDLWRCLLPVQNRLRSGVDDATDAGTFSPTTLLPLQVLARDCRRAFVLQALL